MESEESRRNGDGEDDLQTLASQQTIFRTERRQHKQKRHKTGHRSSASLCLSRSLSLLSVSVCLESVQVSDFFSSCRAVLSSSRSSQFLLKKSRWKALLNSSSQASNSNSTLAELEEIQNLKSGAEDLSLIGAAAHTETLTRVGDTKHPCNKGQLVASLQASRRPLETSVRMHV